MKSESKSSQSRQRYAQQSCESCFGEVLYLATQNERLRGWSFSIGGIEQLRPTKFSIIP